MNITELIEELQAFQSAYGAGTPVHIEVDHADLRHVLFRKGAVLLCKSLPELSDIERKRKQAALGLKQ